MASRGRASKEWRVIGSLLKAGKRVKKIERTVVITSEEELEAAERTMRGDVYEESCKMFKKAEFSDVKIEVDSEISE